MSDEASWEEVLGSRYESRGRGSFCDATFSSAEHLDRAPLLADDAYTEVPVPSLPPANDHCHWRSCNEPPSAVPQLIAALVLCGFFMVCELVGGYIAGSLAIMCDAAHLLSDCGGFGLALLAFHMAGRRPDVHKSYGYRRAEVLGAMASVLLIWLLTGVFVYMAIIRLYTNDYNIEPNIMMVVSGSGVAVNIVMALVLHGSCSRIAHHHSHGGAPCAHTAPINAETAELERDSERRAKVFHNGHQHSHTNGSILNGEYSLKEFTGVETGDREVTVRPTPAKNINLRAALVHVIGDLIQSCGVLLASVLIKFYPAAKMVDPVCTFIFSVLVLCTTVPVVRDALALLMQAVPPQFRYRKCLLALSAVSGVRRVHSLHVWALSSHHVVLTAHVAVDELANTDAVLYACQQIVRHEFDVQSATIQVERYTEAMASCAECVGQPGARP